MTWDEMRREIRRAGGGDDVVVGPRLAWSPVDDPTLRSPLAIYRASLGVVIPIAIR